jgi:hypothetical protein
VRPSSEIISMYETTIGRNTMAIIDFAPQYDGMCESSLLERRE